jgi:EmrB/QacA subfamily drug resistance transporter
MRRLGGVEYKYIVGVVSIFGLFMNLLDMTVINVAIPTLAEDFKVSTGTVGWVITGYTLSLAVFVPVSGWAGDKFGTKRTFMAALAAFTVGSLLCGLAWNIQSLIAFRVLQGMGGGLLTPVGTAMVFRAFPPAERSKASAMILVPTTIAPASGPVLGGFLVQYVSWHWIFFVNLPIGVAGMVAAGLLLREEREPSQSQLDVPGLLLAASGLAMLLYALAHAGNAGFSDPQVAGFGCAGAALLVALVIFELHAPQPMVDVRLFANRLFAACNGVAFAAMIGVSGAMFLLPVLLQLQRGLSPLESGLVTFPQALGVMMVAPLAGRLYPRYGPRRIVAFALAMGSAAYVCFMTVDLGTNSWAIRGIVLMTGWSFGLMQVSLQAATFAAVPREMTSRASAISTCVRQVAMAFGVAVCATVLSTQLGQHDARLGDLATSDGVVLAFHDVFLMLAVITLAGSLLAAVFISDRAAAETMGRGVPSTALE